MSRRKQALRKILNDFSAGLSFNFRGPHVYLTANPVELVRHVIEFVRPSKKTD